MSRPPSPGNDLLTRLRDPKLRRAWVEAEPEQVLAGRVIEARLQKKLSQRALAKKLHTSQAAISRIETGTGNPTLAFMKRLATVLGSRLQISI